MYQLFFKKSHFIILCPVKNPLSPHVFILSCNCCPSKLLSGSDPAFYSIRSVPGFCCFLCSSSLPEERLSPTRISSLHMSQRTFCNFLCFIGSFLKKRKMSSHGTMPENSETTVYNQKCNFLHNSELVLQKQLKH